MVNLQGLSRVVLGLRGLISPSSTYQTPSHPLNLEYWSYATVYNLSTVFGQESWMRLIHTLGERH